MSAPDLQAQVEQAKARLSLAAAACLRNESGAAEEADRARREVDAVRWAVAGEHIATAAAALICATDDL